MSFIHVCLVLWWFMLFWQTSKRNIVTLAYKYFICSLQFFFSTANLHTFIQINTYRTCSRRWNILKWEICFVYDPERKNHYRTSWNGLKTSVKVVILSFLQDYTNKWGEVSELMTDNLSCHFYVYLTYRILEEYVLFYNNDWFFCEISTWLHKKHNINGCIILISRG